MMFFRNLNGNPDLRLFAFCWEDETRRHHPDDSLWKTPESDLFPDNGGITLKHVSPDRAAEDYHAALTPDLFIRPETTAHCRLHPPHPKKNVAGPPGVAPT